MPKLLRSIFTASPALPQKMLATSSRLLKNSRRPNKTLQYKQFLSKFFMLRTKKSLGQNFLRSETMAQGIADAARIELRDTVLEIGPGEGMLTKKLLTTGAQIIAIEKDDRLIPILNETFAKEVRAGQLKLIHADILNAQLSDYGLRATDYILCANIPYYITGAIFRNVIGGPIPPKRAVVLVQHEVAVRIARDPKESLASLALKAY